MKNWTLISAAAWVVSAGAFAIGGLCTTALAQNENRCKEIRQRMADKPLWVDMKFQATELFDASQVINLRRIIKVELNVGLPRPGDSGPILIFDCSIIGKFNGNMAAYGFSLGKDVRLDIGGRKLAAAIPGNVMFITETKYNGGEVWMPASRFTSADDGVIEIYHAVAAELMRGFDFDTWESAGAGNYSKLLRLPNSDLPSHDIGEVLGIAGRGNKLYQIAVQSYSMDFAP